MEFDTEFCLSIGEPYEYLFRKSTVHDHFYGTYIRFSLREVLHLCAISILFNFWIAYTSFLWKLTVLLVLLE